MALLFSRMTELFKDNNPLLNHLGYSPSDLQAKLEAILPIASRIFYQTHIFPLLKMQGKMEEIFIFLNGQQNKEMPVLLVMPDHGHSSKEVVAVMFLRFQSFNSKCITNFTIR